jgi:hypothetical protein
MKVSSEHQFQTPAYALDPLLRQIQTVTTKKLVVWECACGKGNLVKGLRERDYIAFGTDIRNYPDALELDFLKSYPSFEYDIIITNPPYSPRPLKEAFMLRAYQLQKPFAFLMPLTSFEGLERQAMYRHWGLQVIFLNRRINFETPSGEGSGSWFNTSWFTWGFNFPKDIIWEFLPPKPKKVRVKSDKPKHKSKGKEVSSVSDNGSL